MAKPCLKDLWVHSTNCGVTMIYDLSGCCKRQLESAKKQLTRLYKNVQMWGWHMAPSHSGSDWDVWSLRERHTHTLMCGVNDMQCWKV